MTAPAKYNEIDAYAARWIRNLMFAGHLPKGEVDERSIADLTAADVAGPGARHFFAGIGVWAHAMRLAGWPDDANVWSGSCPCQPWSSAGDGLGHADARDLWPEWRRLIRIGRPEIIVGEQVADGGGLAWLDVVSADLEAEGYAFAAFDLCAASVGAPHRRQRLYFGAIRLADDDSSGRRIVCPSWVHADGQLGDDVARRGAVGGVADAAGGRLAGIGGSGESRAAERGATRRVVHPDGLIARRHTGAATRAETKDGREGNERGGSGLESFDPGDRARTFWSAADWLECRDGKCRPVEPGTFPLADGVAERVGQLRAYGNAIVGPLATAFLRCFRDTLIELGRAA